MKVKVFSREDQKFKEVTITDFSKPEISDRLFYKWQDIINITEKIIGVSAVLIMKIKSDSMEVFLKSQNEDNLYEIGDNASLGHGLYGETVIAQNEGLYIKNVLENELWNNNPDILLKMISYYGLPLNWPDDKIFGTVSILDDNNIVLDQKTKILLIEFRDVIENDLRRVCKKDN